MRIIKTAAFVKQAATTTTEYESPEPEAKVTQSADLPQHRPPARSTLSMGRFRRLG